MMASPRLLLRPAGTLKNIQPCIFCQSRQFVRNVHPDSARKPFHWSTAKTFITSSAAYATSPGQRPNVERLRIDVDKHARVGFYTLNRQQRALLTDENTAESIFTDFVAQQNNMDHGSNIKRLAAKYKVNMEILSSIGIMTFKIPDLTDPQKKAMLPPSQNKPTAGLLLRGCAQVEEPLAIIHIMTAVYMSATVTEPSIKELGSLFPRSEVIQYRKTLAKLASSSKPFPLQHEALTLEGQFLEREGKQDKAAPLYVKAITLCPSKFDVTNRHPMQLPLIAPWNALGLLYKQRDTPSAQIEAKKVFAKGAFVGDDPFSYYQLASFEDRTSPQWLQYTSKAAASGHRQAMVDLADFYQEVDLKDSPVLVKSSMRNILNWLLGWRRGSASALAREWLQAASNIGHLPSTLQLADYHSLRGERNQANAYLQKMLEPPISANHTEQWPQLVQVARKRLTGIKA